MPIGSARAASALILAGVLVALALTPIALAYRRVRADQGLVRLPGEVAGFSADVGSYLTVDPIIGRGQALPGYRKPEGELFFGATIALLAVFGLTAGVVRQRTRRCAVVYGVIALTAFVFSLGPQPTAWGRPIVDTGPYAWLAAVVPGLDALRVPARFGVVVLLAVSVLGGLGTARLLELLTPRARAPLVVTACLLVLSDGYAPMPIVGFPPRGAARDAELAAWLVQQPPGAVLHLPLRNGDDRAFELQYQTLLHRHPLVNGASGFMPALYRFLLGEAARLADPAAAPEVLHALRDLGVRYLVIERREFPAAYPRLLRAALAANGLHSREVQIGGFVVLDWAAGNPTWTIQSVSPARRLDPSEFSARATHNPGVLARAFDGRPETRWISGRPQSGDEAIEIQFRRPRNVAQIELLHAPRSDADYPRRLVVEFSEDLRTFHAVYDDSIIRPLIHSLVRAPRTLPVPIPFPENRALAIRVRQTGQTTRMYWSINELIVWER